MAHRYDDDFDLGYDLFNGCVDWDDTPVNLPLGYTRETYEAEMARRDRIYANWGKPA